MLAIDQVLKDVKEWVKEVGDIQKQNLGKENLYIETNLPRLI